MPAERLIRLRSAVREELTRRILPFWLTHTVDRSNGGFVGQVSADNVPDPSAPKGSILHSRILWTFAAAYRALGDEEYLMAASHAALFLRRRFVDERYGGVYWMLDARGNVLDDRKHVYAQAFAIYALAEYHLATGSDRDLQCAIDLFELIDRSAHDTEHGGYEEAFARNWTLLEDVRLSDKDAHARTSMNTHLHVLAAFTNLYRALPDQRLRERVYELVVIFLTHIINEKESTLIQFFDSDWTPKSSATSFGHDSEASWLLLEAAEVLNDDALSERVRTASLAIAHKVMQRALDADGGLCTKAGTVASPMPTSTGGRRPKPSWASSRHSISRAMKRFCAPLSRFGSSRIGTSSIMCTASGTNAWIDKAPPMCRTRRGRGNVPITTAECVWKSCAAPLKSGRYKHRLHRDSSTRGRWRI